jgi:hypothetical protein
MPTVGTEHRPPHDGTGRDRSRADPSRTPPDSAIGATVASTLERLLIDDRGNPRCSPLQSIGTEQRLAEVR